MSILKTNHFIQRCGQRSVRESDVDLVVEFGTPTDRGFLLIRKDVQFVESQCNLLMKQLLSPKSQSTVKSDGSRKSKKVAVIEKQRVKTHIGQPNSNDYLVDLLEPFATSMENFYVLTKQNIIELERKLKKLIDRLTKLQTVLVVTTENGGLAKTVFRPTKEQRRRKLGLG